MGHDTLNNGTDVDLAFGQKLAPNLDLLVGISRESSHETEQSNARNDGGIYGCPRNVEYGATPCGDLTDRYHIQSGLGETGLDPDQRPSSGIFRRYSGS